MAVKIGHASYGENGIRNQIAGDASGKEVLIASWWDKNWDCVLRPKSATIAAKSAKAMEAACANNNIGYDQYGRNTLYTQAKANGFDLAKIKVKCECDCSSLVHVCGIAGGAKLTYGSNGLTTSTMANAFVKSGDYQKLTDKKYLTSDKYLKRGDILVKAGSHTIMILENGASVAADSEKSGSDTSIAAGTKVSLKNTPVYSSEYGATIGKRTGTYYLWDDSVKNGRIRVTNRPDRVGVKGQVSFFAAIADLGLNQSESKSESGSDTSIVAGTKVSLKNTPVYSSEYGATIGKRTGTYYLWDDSVKNGRIRVTNRPDRVGVKGQVSFFIDTSNI